MPSQSSSFLGLSDEMHHVLDKSLETLDELLSGEELPFDTKVAIASRVLQFSAQLSAKTFTSSGDPQSLSHVESLSESSSLSFLPAVYVQFDDFLSTEDYAALEAIIRDKQTLFQATSVVREDKSQQAKTRQSVVLYESNFPKLAERIKKQVLDTLPTACQQLKHPTFQPNTIVAQLTAHNDGCFYKRHSDAATPQTATREMTYVYYFYREPQAFSGGELRLYDTELNNDKPSSRGTYQTINPRNNSIIFFNSRCLHEVMPVKCPSQQFLDGRFTVNGWIRR